MEYIHTKSMSNKMFLAVLLFFCSSLPYASCHVPPDADNVRKEMIFPISGSSLADPIFCILTIYALYGIVCHRLLVGLHQHIIRCVGLVIVDAYVSSEASISKFSGASSAFSSAGLDVGN